MTTFAIWNTAFLGDAILTLPLIQSLKEAFPEVSIDYYVRPGFAALFECHPAIRTVYTADKKARSAIHLLSYGKTLVKRQYTHWICAHTSVRSGIVARLSQALVRIGYFETSCSGLWFTHRVLRDFSKRDEIERILALLTPVHVSATSMWPELSLPAEAHAIASAFFNRCQGPVLGIHPGSVWATKRWPGRYFADVARRALEQGAHVVLFAGPGEEDMALTVAALLKKQTDPALLETHLHNLACKLSLLELAAFIAKLSCYVTNDSGPMHLAWVQKVPVVALFGPTIKDLGFFPRGEASSVLEIPLDCRPCGLHGGQECPKKHHNCMEQLVPELVWPAIEKKLWSPICI